MPNPKYGVIDFTGDRFIVIEKEECDSNKWSVLCNMFRLDKNDTDRITIKANVEYYGIQYDPKQIKTLSKAEFIESFGQSLFISISEIYDTDREPVSYITLTNYNDICDCINILKKFDILSDEIVRKLVMDNVIEVSY